MDIILELIVCLSLAAASFVVLLYFYFKEIDKRNIFVNIFLALIIIFLATAVLLTLRLYFFVLLIKLFPIITIITL